MQFRFSTTATLVAMTLCLGACATAVPVHEALPGTARDKIASTDVVLPIKQSEIYVFVPDSQIAAAGGGGLLLALVDAGVNSVRTTKAEAAVKPLRDAIVDFDFDAALKSDLKTTLAGDSWIHINDPHVIRDVTNESLDGALSHSNAGAVLFVSVDYHLSNDADVFTMTMTASLLPKDAALVALKQPAKSGAKSALVNSIYHNTLVFETAGLAPSDRDHNIALWSAQNGAAMRATLKQGAEKLSAMLAADLQGSDALTNDPDGFAVRSPNGTLRFAAKRPF